MLRAGPRWLCGPNGKGPRSSSSSPLAGSRGSTSTKMSAALCASRQPRAKWRPSFSLWTSPPSRPLTPLTNCGSPAWRTLYSGEPGWRSEAKGKGGAGVPAMGRRTENPGWALEGREILHAQPQKCARTWVVKKALHAKHPVSRPVRRSSFSVPAGGTGVSLSRGGKQSVRPLSW